MPTKNKNHNNNRISLRIKPSENNKIYIRAQELNISRSELIRKLIHKYIHHSHYSTKLDKNQLNSILNILSKVYTAINVDYSNTYRIGGNLNQIAKQLNNNKKLKDVNELVKNCNQYKRCEHYLKKAADMITIYTKSFVAKYKGQKRDEIK